ncbi:MAG: helix-turn-helix domain-containing protein [Bacillota bacterium]
MDLIERLELNRLPAVARRTIERLNTTLEAYEERLSMVGNGQSDGSGQGQAETQSQGEALLTPRDAAERLTISERTLWGLAESGEVPCVRIGRSVRYDPADLRAYIDRRKRAIAG